MNPHCTVASLMDAQWAKRSPTRRVTSAFSTSTWKHLIDSWMLLNNVDRLTGTKTCTTLALRVLHRRSVCYSRLVSGEPRMLAQLPNAVAFQNHPIICTRKVSTLCTVSPKVQSSMWAMRLRRSSSFWRQNLRIAVKNSIRTKESPSHSKKALNERGSSFLRSTSRVSRSCLIMVVSQVQSCSLLLNHHWI